MPSRSKPSRPPRRAPAKRRSSATPAAKPHRPSRPAARPPTRRPETRAAPTPSPAPAAAPAPRPLGRQHVLSLSFLRDGDEFLARIETDGGQITELKNRVLDQLLTLVAGELEDLLE